MIAIVIEDPNLETATIENHAGEWCFAINRVKDKKLSREEVFSVTGSWRSARPKAEAHARAWGAKHEMNSVLLLTKFTASEAK
jgi:hypothetical protein